MKTKLIFIGSGSAFNTTDLQSNVLIEKNNKRFMIDCGSFALIGLKHLNLLPKDIDAIYISHLHNDHIGNMEAMAFMTYFDPTKKKIKLFGESRLIDDLWDKCLQGGLKSIQGKRVELTDYFDVHRIDTNGTFKWEDMEFKMVQVCHVVDAYSIVPSYGLMFKDKDKTHFMTTDTQYAPSQISAFYDEADVIYQDCETAPFKSGVHAHYTELLDLPTETKKKMHLYHYQAGDKPDCTKDGFAGWCMKSQMFDV